MTYNAQLLLLVGIDYACVRCEHSESSVGEAEWRGPVSNTVMACSVISVFKVLCHGFTQKNFFVVSLLTS